MRQPYSLQLRNGIYYYIIYDSNNKRKKYSTGLKSKSKALNFIQQKISEGTLIPEMIDKTIFGSYFKNWWGPDCPYCKESLIHGKEFSKSHKIRSEQLYRCYIMPFFSDLKIAAITTKQINDFKYSLIERKSLANKTINHILQNLSVMFEFAYRDEIIDINPCKRVRNLANNCRERGILSREEVVNLFSKPWSNPLVEAINLTAMFTGMRLGEIRGLKVKDLHEKYIHCASSFTSGELKGTKTGIIRDIPIPIFLYSKISYYCSDDPEAYVFSLNNVDPISAASCLKYLRSALISIGITLDEQKSRNICFHSWRHFLNSQLRVSGVSDIITKKVTGHTTDEMMEHYTHVSKEDMAIVNNVQEGLLSFLQ